MFGSIKDFEPVVEGIVQVRWRLSPVSHSNNTGIFISLRHPGLVVLPTFSAADKNLNCCHVFPERPQRAI